MKEFINRLDAEMAMAEADVLIGMELMFDDLANNEEYDDDYDDIGEMYPCDFSGFCGGPSCSRFFQCKGKG